MSPTHTALVAVTELRVAEYRTSAANLLRKLSTLPHGGCDSYTGRTWKRARRMLRRARTLEIAARKVVA